MSDATAWFDESPAGPTVIRRSTSRRYHNTGGINTSVVDAYRQGVEITLPIHLALGLAKMGTGEVHGTMRQDTFGVDSVEQTIAFIDGGADSTERLSFDGVIEGLSIRDVINGNDTFHTVKGALMAGTEDTLGTSAQMTPTCVRDLREHASPAFEDSADTLGGIPYGQSVHAGLATIMPVDDTAVKSGVRVPNNADVAFTNAIAMMSPSTDAGPDTFATATCVAGFTYDSQQTVGTDSLAFGGLER